MKKYIKLLAVILGLSASVSAQQDFILYNMYDIPQSSYSNPSNQFNGRFFIGAPLISSDYYSLSNSGFSYSDAVKKRGDSLVLDFNSLIDELEDENFTSFNTKIDLLSFGMHLGKKTQLTFNVTENINVRFNYTKDFVRFIYEGNAAFEDNTADFKNLGLSMNHYREYGLGLSHAFTEKLRIGARLKYLYGMENIYSEKTDLSLRTDPETFALTANADVAIRTSGVGDYDIDEEGFSNYAFGRDNSGYGLDLGGHYELNDKLSFNASVLDLGYINWNHKVENYIIEKGNYTYSGIEIDAFTVNDQDTTGDTSFDRVIDSIETAFDVKENSNKYTTPLTTRIYLGANYKIGQRMVVGGLFQSEFFEGLKPSFTVSATRKMTKWITLATSLTYINRTISNVGFGLNVNPGPVQLYLISDNILGAFQPQHARHAQVRFGINFIFGGTKSTEIHHHYDGNGEVSNKEKKKNAKEDKKNREKSNEE